MESALRYAWVKRLTSYLQVPFLCSKVSRVSVHKLLYGSKKIYRGQL